MRSYLIHIYRRGNHAVPEGDAEIVGVVEGIENERRYPFTNPKELWDILAGKDLVRFSTDKPVKNEGVCHD